MRVKDKISEYYIWLCCSHYDNLLHSDILVLLR